MWYDNLMPKNIEVKEKDLEATPVVTQTSETSLSQKITPVKKPKSPSKLKLWLEGLKPWQRMLLFFTLGALVLGGLGIGTYYYVFKLNSSPLSILSLQQNYVSAAGHSTDYKDLFKKIDGKLAKPGEPRTEESPLNGVLYTAAEMKNLMEKRPIAVMINNHVASRPQSALTSADVVYEALVESGITRYMGVFWSASPNKVGSLRSARQVYLEWLSEYNALYMHDGCASTTDPRTNACGNIYTYGIRDLATYGAWRDFTRVAPHNEYVSPVTAWEYADTVDWNGFPSDFKPLKFKRDAKADARGTKTHIKIRFREDLAGGGLYDTEWIYDAVSNSYKHKIGTQADLDLETGKQVTAKVVVVQDQKAVSSGDDKGRMIITAIGKGDATILQDGKITEATWEKKSRTDRTRYYDKAGKEIELNRGRLWIISFSYNLGKFDILEQ
jgi:hypothetical protein